MAELSHILSNILLNDNTIRSKYVSIFVDLPSCPNNMCEVLKG
jgi:hypothetical protein